MSAKLTRKPVKGDTVCRNCGGLNVQVAMWVMVNQNPPEIADDFVNGDAYACAVEPGACPFCYVSDVVTELPPPLLAEQPDDTTHVCNPFLGGHGFAKDKVTP